MGNTAEVNNEVVERMGLDRIVEGGERVHLYMLWKIACMWILGGCFREF